MNSKGSFTEGKMYVLGGAVCRCTRALLQTRMLPGDVGLQRYWEYHFTTGHDGSQFDSFHLEEHHPGVFWIDGDPSMQVPAPVPVP